MIVEETNCEIKAVYLWTNSEIVIHYMKNEITNIKVFIVHRINEVRSNSTVDQ